MRLLVHPLVTPGNGVIDLGSSVGDACALEAEAFLHLLLVKFLIHDIPLPVSFDNFS